MEEEIKKEIIGKAGFPLYVDYWEKYFSQMSGEQVKECLKIIFHFNTTFEVLRSDDLAINMVVITIIDNLKRDAQKRIKQSKASRGNGLLGGRPKKDDKPKKPKKTQDNPQEPIGLLNAEDQFEEFWKSYNPIHTSKGVKKEAQEAFAKALKKDTIENITKGLKDYMSECHAKGTYTKQVDGWLKKMMWKGEYLTESKTPEVKSQKEIWAEKILKSNKPADYEEVMKVAAFEADYKYFENDKFYFLAENEAIKTRCKERVKEIELELFKLKNNQCQVFIISKNYFDGK